MTKAVILGLGPSKSAYIKQKGDYVFGCNNIFDYRDDVDAVVIVDSPQRIFSARPTIRNTPSKIPKYVRDKAYLGTMDNIHVITSHRQGTSKEIDYLKQPISHGSTCPFYACVVAMHLGYKEIEVFGVDHSGNHPLANENNRNRTAKEFKKLIAFAETQGIKIKLNKACHMYSRINENKMDKDNKTLIVPPGIGDNLWVLMTLDQTKGPYKVKICKSNIDRGGQLYDLMPKALIESWEYSDKRYPKDCNYRINHHLESGKRIEAFSGIVNHSLPFKLGKTRPVFKREEGKVYFGIYTSNKENNRAWKGWDTSEQWKKFMTLIRSYIPNVEFVGIGAKYDNLMDELDFDHVCRDESLAKAIKTIQNLDYMFGFPSGIPILAEYFSVKTFMFFPDKLDKMQNAFAFEGAIEDKSWKGCRFCEPKRAADWIKDNWL